MRKLGYLAAVCGVLSAGPALAWVPTVNLTGKYRCVAQCASGLVGAPAYVTQNGWSMNVVNDAGQASRAWFSSSWNTRLWMDDWHTSAVYSPDGMTIQFDNGALWQRDFGAPPVVRVRRIR